MVWLCWERWITGHGLWDFKCSCQTQLLWLNHKLSNHDVISFLLPCAMPAYLTTLPAMMFMTHSLSKHAINIFFLKLLCSGCFFTLVTKSNSWTICAFRRGTYQSSALPVQQTVAGSASFDVKFAMQKCSSSLQKDIGRSQGWLCKD